MLSPARSTVKSNLTRHGRMLAKPAQCINGLVKIDLEPTLGGEVRLADVRVREGLMAILKSIRRKLIQLIGEMRLACPRHRLRLRHVVPLGT